MKKLAAILLLIIFLFNLAGYKFVFSYAQQQSDIQLQSSIDKAQYNDAELLAIKVPLSMPYQTVQSDWERVDGEITVSGKIYKYVKRRIADGEMVLMCLPDQNKMRIQTARNDFFKNTTDVAQNNASKKSDNAKNFSFKNLMGDYEHYATTYSISAFSDAKTNAVSRQSDKLLSSPRTPIVPPPNAM